MCMKSVNNCVSCDLPCIGSSCYLTHQIEYECDGCTNEDCKYHVFDGEEDFCEECFENELNSQFSELSIKEQRDILSDSLLDTDKPSDFEEIWNGFAIDEKAAALDVDYVII